MDRKVPAYYCGAFSCSVQEGRRSSGMARNSTRPLVGKDEPSWNHTEHQSRVLVLTGPPGTGKKTVVRVLADCMGYEVCEWAAPAPVLWNEHLHHNNIGFTYSSKFDDFEAFTESCRKFPSLPLSTQGNPRKHRLILIDDLPFVSGDDKKQQLSQLLQRLITGAQFPTVIVLTETSEDGGGQGVAGGVIQTALRAGALKIAFNPVTVKATEKVLTRILKEANYELPIDVVAEVAATAAGDIRNAVLSIQLLCAGRQASVKARRNKSRRKNPRDAIEEDLKPIQETNAGRDTTLSLFHALGKFLHNKRFTNELPDSGEKLGFTLQGRYTRQPVQMVEPESIIEQARAETSTLMCFFHENVLEFVDDEAIGDVADIMGYLSDADCLAGKFSWQWRKERQSSLLDAGWTNASQLGESAAASIAARGVLFGNAHPAPSKWQTLRSPILWQVEKSRASKQAEMFAENNRACGAIWATEYVPYLRKMSAWTTHFRGHELAPRLQAPEDMDEIEDS